MQEKMKEETETIQNSLPDDPEMFSLIEQEKQRQSRELRLIPSENYVSRNVLNALGSVLVNKYSEGYPGFRYYEGTEVVDKIESLTRERAKKLFGVDHANVQPYSGSPANMAVYFALLKPGETMLGMGLRDGGHLTHGAPASFSSRFYKAISYHVNPQTGYLEMNQVRELAKEHKPSLIICGGSAYPRILDFSAFREIANEVGARLLVDMAHFGGLVAAGSYPSPAPYADIITMTTHKVLRGPRGGLILCKSDYAQAIDRAIFPGLQGGPHNHTIAGIAVALHEAASPAYKNYGKKVVENAKELASQLLSEGFTLVTGGTDTHLMLIDLRPKNLPGSTLAKALARAGIVCNANTVPGETGSPKHPSGLRLGTPAVTTQGMGKKEMQFIAKKISAIASSPTNENLIAKTHQEVEELSLQYPIPC